MTIKDLVHTIKNIALKHNFIKNFNEGDIYEFMNNGEKQYGVINLTIDTINRVSANIMQLNATIIYIDRLTEDNANKLDIWTTGTNTIQQILNSLKQKGIMVDDTYDFTAFTEDEFQDLCAGVYATIEIQMVNNINECKSITRRDIDITKNGTYNISEYDIANVDVEYSIEQSLFMTIEEYEALGEYNNKTIYNITDNKGKVIQQYQGETLIWEEP